MKKVTPIPLLVILLLYGNLSLSQSESNDSEYCPMNHYNCYGLRVFGSAGIGLTLGTQEKRLYLFTQGNLNYNPEKKGFGFGGETKIVVYNNHKLYNTKFSNTSNKKRKNWTYEPSLKLTGGFTFHNKYFEGSYQVKSYNNTRYYRKLSNNVATFGVELGEIEQKYGFRFEFQNDVFWPQTISDPKRDHGETQNMSFGIFRYEKGSHAEIWDDRFYYIGYTERMITDRRSLLRAGDYNSIYGRYETLEDVLKNCYHYYRTADIQVSSSYGTLKLGIGADDLLKGRNRQRFAHQGLKHLNKNDKTVKFKCLKKAFQKKFFPDSPLFPWESQPEFYLKPKFYIYSNLSFNPPVIEKNLTASKN